MSAEAIGRVWSVLRNLVTRGKLIQSRYNAAGTRTMLQLGVLQGEIHDSVELLLPYGFSAKPVGASADFLLFQVNGNRDHKVALGGDDPALRIPDLQGGEFGLRNTRGSQVVMRNNKIEVTAPLDDIDVTAAQGNINVTASAGNLALAAKSVTLTGLGGGNLALTVGGNATLGASGSLALTAAPGEITANGTVIA